VTPATVLLERLADARRRGGSFEEAWPDALRSAVEAASGRERREWRAVLEAMVDVWRGAFERRPAKDGERAMRMVAETPAQM